jgi:hypothetical protein
MQEVKLKSWKTSCTINDGVNPRNIVYKTASGNIRTGTGLTALEKDGGTYTTDRQTDTRSTIMHMLEHFVPDDREDGNELHRKIRKEIQEPPDTADDKDFTKEEIIANLKTIQLEKGSWRGCSN